MVALLKTFPPFLLRSPLDTLKASADEDSCWSCEDDDDDVNNNAWLLSLHSLFVEHSLPTLSFTMLEEAHSKLLLRLVAEEEEVDKEMEVDEEVEEVEEDWDDTQVEDEEWEEEEVTTALNVDEDGGKEQDCISSPVMLLVLSCSPETAAKGSVLVASRVTNLDVG